MLSVNQPWKWHIGKNFADISRHWQNYRRMLFLMLAKFAIINLKLGLTYRPCTESEIVFYIYLFLLYLRFLLIQWTKLLFTKILYRRNSWNEPLVFISQCFLWNLYWGQQKSWKNLRKIIIHWNAFSMANVFLSRSVFETIGKFTFLLFHIKAILKVVLDLLTWKRIR